MSRNRSALTAFNRDVVRPGAQRGLRVVVPGGGSAPASTVAPVFLVTIDGGNDVYPASGVWSVVKGVKYNSSGLNVLPAAVPTNGSTYADGIGYGKLLDANGVAIAGLVWLINRTVTTSAPGSAVFSPVTAQPVVKGGCAFCLYKVPMNVTGGGTTFAYVVWRV